MQSQYRRQPSEVGKSSAASNGVPFWTNFWVWHVLSFKIFEKTPTRNAKCPIVLGNFTPKTSNYCLKNRVLGFTGISSRGMSPKLYTLPYDTFKELT